MNDYQHVESYMRTRSRTLMQTDWYQAGHTAGTAPTEWEMTKYGRDTALGWLGTRGESMETAISRGFRAIYDYAYADVRDTIRRTAGTRGAVAATSQTEIFSLNFGPEPDAVYDVLDWIARAPLTQVQRRIVFLYSEGWMLSEVSEDLGLNYSNVLRWFHQALPILGRER